jgi:predicted  nucleic acid-binding Zn-ribbon protein
MSSDRKEPKEYSLNKLEEQAKELEEEILEFEVKLDESDWDPKIDYERQIDALKIELSELKERMEELNSVDEAGWKELPKEVESDLARLADNVKLASDTLDEILLE